MTARRIVLAASAVLVLVLPVGCGSGSGSDQSSTSSGQRIASGAGPNGPTEVSSSDFSATVDNPYYPLKPGTTYRYRGDKDGKPTIDVYAVSHETKTIEGVPCVA